MPAKTKIAMEAAGLESADMIAADMEPFEWGDDKDDPLAGLEYPGDIAGDCAVEIAALDCAFKRRAEAENARHKKATDSEFWVCLCFQSREQVMEFLKQTGWGQPKDKYVDGTRVARKLGVRIPEDTTSFSAVKINRRYSKYAKQTA